MGESLAISAMDLRNLFIVTDGMGDPTAITDRPFQGDPFYRCEEASPREISRVCRENPRIKIVRH
jgi:hypothetical protein